VIHIATRAASTGKLVEAAGARWRFIPDPADVVTLLKDR
jgi:hypothetical protein